MGKMLESWEEHLEGAPDCSVALEQGWREPWRRDMEWESLPGQRCSVSKVRKVLTAGASLEPSLGEATATNTHFTSRSQCFSRQRETVSEA